MTETKFRKLRVNDKVYYRGGGMHKRLYPVDQIVDTGGLRQVFVNGICISNPRVLELAADVNLTPDDEES